MAAFKFSVFFLFLLCCMSLALPVTRDLKTSDTEVQSEVLTKIEPVLSFGSENVLVRTKRNTMRGRGCSRGKVFFKTKCISRKKYKELTEGDYDEE